MLPDLLTLVALIALLATAGGALVAWRNAATRLSRLNDELTGIAEEGSGERRVSSLSGGTGEFKRLEQNVNRLFDVMDGREREQRDREELFRALAENVPEGIIIHREDLLYVNPRAAAMRGVRQRDLVGRPLTELVHPNHREQALSMTRDRLAGRPAPERYEIKLLDRAGDPFWVEASSTLIEFRGEPAVLTAGFDVTRRKRLVDAISRERDRKRLTVDSIGEGVVTTDAEGVIDYANAAAARLLGAAPVTLVGERFEEAVRLLDENDHKPMLAPLASCLKSGRALGLARRALLIAGGEEFYVELNVAPLRDDDGETLGAVVVLHDVTELRGLTRQMSYQASHDSLTGLINRREFERRLEDALAAARADNSGHVACYLDLDRFKAVNDGCGHMAGDNVLREVSGLIREQVRDSDSVARLGGDEFGLLLVGCPLDKARQIADDVCRAVEHYRFVWRDKIFTVGVSVGLVEISHESGTVVDVLTAADSACYIAKQGGTRVHVYSARDEAAARHGGEIAWLQTLQHALKEERFELYSQPIVSATGHVTEGPACELLLRLRDEQGREIVPGDFIDAAERYKLMASIDRWVIKTAFTAIGRGGIRLPDYRSCTINLSGQTLADAQFLEFVVECLDATGVPPERVCFELTESAVVTNLSHARRFIEVLHGMGCRFALDDFGTGLGSFTNLKDLSMDYVKIDGTFTRGLGDEVNRAMVGAMIELARTLHIRVVAEQVEDQAALDAVRRLGVDFVQGFAIGRPRPMSAAATAA